MFGNLKGRPHWENQDIDEQVRWIWEFSTISVEFIGFRVCSSCGCFWLCYRILVHRKQCGKFWL